MTHSNLSFEAAYARLEEILEKMNSGKASLEDALKLYEEADKLIHFCSKRLTEAEKKIEVLVKNRETDPQLNEEGQPITQPFLPSSAAPFKSQRTKLIHGNLYDYCSFSKYE